MIEAIAQGIVGCLIGGSIFQMLKSILRIQHLSDMPAFALVSSIIMGILGMTLLFDDHPSAGLWISLGIFLFFLGLSIVVSKYEHRRMNDD